jgi:RNA polymerase sigma factor (sigma-70 family)
MNESSKDENIKNEALKILIKEADLSERVKNCLFKLNIINVEDLINLNEKDLLSIRDFGKKSLREIHYFIEQYGLKLRSRADSGEFSSGLDNKNDAINAKLKKDYTDKYEILSTKILNTPLSIRTKNCLIELNIKDVGEAIQYGERELLRAKNFGEKSLNEFNNYLAQYNLVLGSDLIWPPQDYEKILKDVESKKFESLKIDENNLINEINNLLKTRERYVIQQRFWFGRTLEEIAGDLQPKVTRERVRQIESKALRKIKNLLELNLIKFLEENKINIFLQYSESQNVITEKSLIKATKKNIFPVKAIIGLTFVAIDILHKNINNFFDKNFISISGGWYRGTDINVFKDYLEEIKYYLDKKPLPRQCESLRLLSKIPDHLFKDCALLIDSSTEYYLIDNYFCSLKSKNFYKVSSFYLTKIHEIAFSFSPNKFLTYNSLFNLVKKDASLKEYYWSQNQSRLKDLIKGKSLINTNHLFIFASNKIMPIGNYYKYFDNHSDIEEVVKNENIFSEEKIQEKKISIYQDTVSIIIEIFKDKKILSIQELSIFYVKKIKQQILPGQAVRLLNILLSNNNNFILIAPGIWSLSEIRLTSQDIAEYHIRNNSSYSLDMYCLFRRGNEHINSYSGWSYEFEKYLCINGEGIFNKESYESLINISSPEKWDANDDVINKYIQLKRKSNFYLKIRPLSSFNISDDKNLIIKYNVENIARTILYIYDNQNVSVIGLNKFLGIPLYYNTSHYYLVILSIAGVLEAPDDNLKSYFFNNTIICELKDIIIDEFVEFGNINWSRNFGKRIIEMVKNNYSIFITKQNWITDNLKFYDKI